VGGFVNSNIKTAIFWVVLICLIVILYTVVSRTKHPAEEQIAFTDFIDQVKDKKIRDVNIAGNEVCWCRRRLSSCCWRSGSS
jgi:cell division protease FtsH